MFCPTERQDEEEGKTCSGGFFFFFFFFHFPLFFSFSRPSTSTTPGRLYLRCCTGRQPTRYTEIGNKKKKCPLANRSPSFFLSLSSCYHPSTFPFSISIENEGILKSLVVLLFLFSIFLLLRKDVLFVQKKCLSLSIPNR